MLKSSFRNQKIKSSAVFFVVQGEQGTVELGAKTVLKQTNKLCF